MLAVLLGLNGQPNRGKFDISAFSLCKLQRERKLKILRTADRHNKIDLREESLHALALKFGEICEVDAQHGERCTRRVA